MKIIFSNQCLDRNEEILDLKYPKIKGNSLIILKLIILNKQVLVGYLVKHKNMNAKSFNSYSSVRNIL